MIIAVMTRKIQAQQTGMQDKILLHRCILEKASLTQQPIQDKILMAAQEKKMALCEICGSFLVANDAAERTQSHVTGKQHMGYGMVRDFLAEYKEKRDQLREQERLARENEAKERQKLREKENEGKYKESNPDDMDRHRHRDHGRGRDHRRDPDYDRYQERNARDNRKGSRGPDRKNYNSSNGRNWGRDKSHDQERSRSRSPIRHGHRRSLRSPDRLV